MFAQGEPVFSPTSGADSPFAEEREVARAELSAAELLAAAREILRKGEPTSQVAGAIDVVARAKDKADVALVAPYVSSIEPSIADAAMSALRSFGREALAALDALRAGEVDAPTRAKVREQLLRDHIMACCYRDIAVNPLQLEFPARLDELLSIRQDLDDLMLSLLRESIADLRQDINGQYINRRYYYGYMPEEDGPKFIEYGGLVVAALARNKPDLLKRETEGLYEKNQPQGYGYYWGQVRQNATRELCCFLARNGLAGPALKMVSDMEMTLRFQQDPGFSAGVHVDIAAVMMSAGVSDAQRGNSFSFTKGPFELALITDHLDTALQGAGSLGLGVASQARYLKARLLMAQGDEGGALRELEESVEASDEPMLLLVVDTAFASLGEERRFKTLLAYTALVARRVDERARPYTAAR